MKKIITFVGTYFCYYVGSFFGYLMNLSYLDFLYELYKKFMVWSFEIQEWGGLKKPWSNNKNKDVKEFEI